MVHSLCLNTHIVHRSKCCVNFRDISLRGLLCTLHSPTLPAHLPINIYRQRHLLENFALQKQITSEVHRSHPHQSGSPRSQSWFLPTFDDSAYNKIAGIQSPVSMLSVQARAAQHNNVTWKWIWQRQEDTSWGKWILVRGSCPVCFK